MEKYYFTETLAKGTISYINEAMEYLNHLEILTNDDKVLNDFIERVKELLDSVLTDFEIASETNMYRVDYIYYAKKLSVEDLKTIIEEKEKEEIINKCL